MCPTPGDKDTKGGGTPKTPKTRTSKKKELPAIAGKEVVGRQIAVWSQKQMGWPKAVIAQFNVDKGEHLIRYNERTEGSVKHEEHWLNLGRTRFQWLGSPTKDATPNPTFNDAPRKEDVIGYQVKVFWPGMAKWYQGKVEDYNPKTGRHTVKYRDGDIQELNLRHEAVVYVSKSATPIAPKVATDPAKVKKRPKTPSKRPRTEDSSDDRKSKSGRSSTREDGTVKSGKSGAAARRKHGHGGNPGGERSAGTSGGGRGKLGSEDPDDEETVTDDGGEESDVDDGSEVYIEELPGEEDSDFDGAGQIQKFPRGPKGSRKLQRMGSNKKQRSNAIGRAGSIKQSNISRQTSRGGSGVPRELGGVPKRRGRPPGSGVGRRLGRLASDTSNRLLKVRQLTRAEEETLKVTGGAVVGARVAVLWSEDGSFYKGKLVQFDSYHKRHKLLYDDGEEEWSALQREHFRCLIPRARSAGCTTDFIEAMNQLGGGNGEGLGGVPGGAPDAMSTRSQLSFAHLGTAVPTGETAAKPPSTDAFCVNWAVSVHCDLDRRWYKAEVLSYDPDQRRLLVLYDDGEDEWLDPDAEKLAWHTPVGKERKGMFPGLVPGMPHPVGKTAVGWRVAVFWKGDAAFYPGEIRFFNESSGKHEVSYDDGEEGTIILNEDRVKWILPPGVAVDHENLERREAGGTRPARKVTAGGDSDPDYEFEHQQHQAMRVGRGRGGHRGGPLPMYRSGSLWRDEDQGSPGGWMSGIGMMHHNGNGHHHHHRGHHHHHHSQSAPGARPHGQLMPQEGPTGQPALVRQLSRVPSFALHHSDTDGSLQAAVTVRVYLSGRTLGESGGSQEAAPPSNEEGARSKLEALSYMARRVARAQQAIVKGVPTPLPLHVTPPILHLGRRTPQNTPRYQQQNQNQTTHNQNQQQNHHRLARPPITSYSPFQRSRPRLSDDEEDEDDDDEDEELERSKDTGYLFNFSNPNSDADEEGATSRDGFGDGDGDAEDAMMSPRSLALRGAKVKPGSNKGTPTGPGEVQGPPNFGSAAQVASLDQLKAVNQVLQVGLGSADVVEAANNAAHGGGLVHSPSMETLGLPPLPVVDSVGNLLGLTGGAGGGQDEVHHVLQEG